MEVKELIERVQAELSKDQSCTLSKKEVRRVIDALCTVIEHGLTTNQPVPIPGLGRLVPTRMGSRMAHNPKTGEKTRVPPRFTVKFKPSFGLRQQLRR